MVKFYAKGPKLAKLGLPSDSYLFNVLCVHDVGKGFYNYGKPGGRKAEIDPEVTQMIVDFSEKAGITRRHISAQVGCHFMWVVGQLPTS